MPLPLAAAIPAAASLVTAGGNIAFNAAANKKQRAWSERMYQRQYNDNVNFWNLQNEYNSPRAEMQRYKDAGLNPNLIYGNSNSGGSAGSIATPDIQQTQFRTPDISGIQGAGSVLSQFQDFQIKQAQIDIMKQQGNNLALQNMGLEFKNQILGLDYSDKQTMLPTRQATEVARLDQIRANTRFTMTQEELNKVRNASDLQTALQMRLSFIEGRAKSRTERAQIEQATRNLKKDYDLKAMDANLRRIGVMPGSPAWMNAVGTFFNLLMGVE